MNERVLIAAAVLLLGGATLAIGFGPHALRAYRERQVLRIGTEAEAVVLDLQDTGSRVNRDPVLRIVLELRPAGQAPFRAEVRRIVGIAEAERFARGRVLKVKFDPARPERVAILEDQP